MRWGLLPHLLEKGELLLREGDLGHAVYLVVEGEIAVRKAVGADQLPLAVLRTGALVGTGGLLLGRPRNASCVAAKRSWVYAMNRESFCAMRGEAGARVPRSAALRARTQTKSASGQLAKLVAREEEARSEKRGLHALLNAASTALVFQGGGDQAAIELSSSPLHEPVEPGSEGKRRLLESIRSSIIGADEAMEGPYGLLRITYADYGSSGRCLGFIEDFIQNEVMPFYASTQADASGTSRQTARYREDARQIIRECVDAGDDDAVIFCGSGATAAINKLIDVLNLRLPAELSRTFGLETLIPHKRAAGGVHRSLRARLEPAAVGALDRRGGGGRRRRARRDRSRRARATADRIQGASAAHRQLRGGLERQRHVADVAGLSQLLHRHGALAFWDYAAAGAARAGSR